ncbi:MAG: hypothetical protein AAGB93_00805 [Planctomycetota bacterium]
MNALLALLVTSVTAAFAPGADAQSVVVMWGDSVVAGVGSHVSQPMPMGPAPFGSPIPCGYRWNHSTMSFDPITEADNNAGNGADLTYGFAEAWLRFRNEPVYIVSLAFSGTDCNPINIGRSWHPASGSRLLPRLHEEVSAALAHAPTHAGTSGSATLECIVFCTGNNSPSLDLVQNIEAVNNTILGWVPTANPIQIGVSTWRVPPGNGNLDTTYNRMLMGDWKAAAPVGQTRQVVDADQIPSHTGGLPDMAHLSHWGEITLGFQAGVLAQ